MATYEFLTAEYQFAQQRILMYSSEKGREEFACATALARIGILDDLGAIGWELMDWEKSSLGFCYWFRRSSGTDSTPPITFPTDNILGIPIDGRAYPNPLFFETDTKNVPVACGTSGIEYLICALKITSENNKSKVLLKHITLSCSDASAQEFRYRLLLNPTIESEGALAWGAIHTSKPNFVATRGIVATPSTSKITDANKVLDGGYCRKLEHTLHIVNIVLPLVKDTDVIVLAAMPMGNNVEIYGSMSGVLINI